VSAFSRLVVGKGAEFNGGVLGTVRFVNPKLKEKCNEKRRFTIRKTFLIAEPRSIPAQRITELSMLHRTLNEHSKTLIRRFLSTAKENEGRQLSLSTNKQGHPPSVGFGKKSNDTRHKPIWLHARRLMARPRQKSVRSRICFDGIKTNNSRELRKLLRWRTEIACTAMWKQYVPFGK
jgi:hypothetical protein